MFNHLYRMCFFVVVVSNVALLFLYRINTRKTSIFGTTVIITTITIIIDIARFGLFGSHNWFIRSHIWPIRVYTFHWAHHTMRIAISMTMSISNHSHIAQFDNWMTHEHNNFNYFGEFRYANRSKCKQTQTHESKAWLLSLLSEFPGFFSVISLLF